MLHVSGRFYGIKLLQLNRRGTVVLRKKDYNDDFDGYDTEL